MSRCTLRWALPVLLLAALLLFAGCATELKDLRTHPQDISKLKPGQTVLVGQVVLDPPIGKNEQEVNNSIFTSTDYKKPLLVFDDQHVDYSKENDATAHAGNTEYVSHDFGKTFYAPTTNHPAYVNGLYIYLKMNTDKVAYDLRVLQTDLVVDARPGDKAVYIGTIRYVRNDLWDLKKIEVVDDYAREKRRFKKIFGGGVKLVKRLAHRVPASAAR